MRITISFHFLKLIAGEKLWQRIFLISEEKLGQRRGSKYFQVTGTISSKNRRKESREWVCFPHRGMAC